MCPHSTKPLLCSLIGRNAYRMFFTALPTPRTRWTFLTYTALSVAGIVPGALGGYYELCTLGSRTPKA